MNPAVAALVAKDLHMNRAAIISTLVSGVISLGLCFVHPIGIMIGGLGFLSGIIVYGCMLAGGIWKERETGSLLFSLSLPLSARDYLTARALGVSLSYLAAWVPLVAGAAVTISLSHLLPHGLILFIILLCVFLLLEFSLLIAVALLTRTEGLLTATFILTNTAVTLYFWGMTLVPPVARTMRAPEASWDGTTLGILAIQLVLAIVLLVLPSRIVARRSLL